MLKVDANTEYRKKDVILIRASVRYGYGPVDRDREYMTATPLNINNPEEYRSDIMVPISSIAGIETRAWKRSDTANICDGDVQREVTVLAVHGADVWVQLPDGATTILSANDLTPIPEEPEVAEPAASPPVMIVEAPSGDDGAPETGEGPKVEF